MASPPLLNFETLLAPIPGENPAGEPFPYDARLRFEEDRKEEDPNDFAADDPMRPAKPKRANWPGIIQSANETLAKQSKDLLVAARLTEALTRQHGFGGLRDGLHLMRLLVEQCWDRLHPVIEDGDVEGRASPFFWLDDADRGARFPNMLRLMPMIKGETGQFSYLDWRRSQEGQGTVSREDVEKAIDSAEPEACQILSEDVSKSLEELNQLTASLNGKMGPAAPGLSGLRQALEGCRLLATTVAERRPIPGAAAASGRPGNEGSSGGAAGVPASRAEVYRQLGHAASLLRQLEPHSPIPYLIQKAVELGALPFPLLIRELVRDANVLEQLNRELGIKGEKPSEAKG